MRTTLMLGLLAFALIATGCSTNSSADHILGPKSTAQMSGSVTLPDPSTPPDVTPAIYGRISDLNAAAGTFTLTSPDGTTHSVSYGADLLVVYQDSPSHDPSLLDDGQWVTVTGVIMGLPSQAKVRARMIVINGSLVSQNMS